MTGVLQSIAGKAVLVTGAGSGLGAATARLLASHGATVTVVDVDTTHGAGVAREINGFFALADVTSEADVRAAIAVAEQSVDGGPLFAAVNCAGICPAAKLLGKRGPHPLETFQKTIHVNLVGTFNVCRLAAESMNKHPMPADEPRDAVEMQPAAEDRGVIINTASVAAYEGQIGQAAYAASKGGIVSLTLPLSRELSAQRIRVNAICPGVMETPLLPASLGEQLGRTVPYPHRLGRPEEFASLVHFLMTNRYMNGASVRLDGSVRLTAK